MELPLGGAIYIYNFSTSEQSKRGKVLKMFFRAKGLEAEKTQKKHTQ